jgi:hypothetical protein
MATARLYINIFKMQIKTQDNLHMYPDLDGNSKAPKLFYIYDATQLRN